MTAAPFIAKECGPCLTGMEAARSNRAADGDYRHAN